MGVDDSPTERAPLSAAQVLEVQATKPGDPGGSDAATVAQGEPSTAHDPSAATASPQKGAGSISGELKDGGVGIAAAGGKVVPLEAGGISSSAASDAVAPLATGSGRETAVSGGQDLVTSSAAVATAAEDREGQSTEDGAAGVVTSPAGGGEGVEEGGVRHSDGSGVGGVDGSGSQLRSSVDGQKGAAAGGSELAVVGGDAGGSAVQAAIEQRRVELREQQQRQEVGFVIDRTFIALWFLSHAVDYVKFRKQSSLGSITSGMPRKDCGCDGVRVWDSWRAILEEYSVFWRYW